MWTCPKCNARLVQKNMSHSCGSYTVDGFLGGKTERGKELFWLLVNEFSKIGRVTLHPVKTRVALMVDVRFAAVNKIGSDFIEGHLWLKERRHNMRFFKVERLNNDYIHHFRISDEADIDAEFRRCMQMAFEIGQRKHIKRTQRK